MYQDPKNLDLSSLKSWILKFVASVSPLPTTAEVDILARFGNLGLTEVMWSSPYVDCCRVRKEAQSPI